MNKMIYTLFLKNGCIRDLLEQRRYNLKQEIENYERNKILNISEEDISQYLIDKYSLEIPILHEDKIHTCAPEDVKVYGRIGTRIMIIIPFEGDGKLFHYQPSTTSNFPKGEILGQEIHLICDIVEDNAEKLKEIYIRELNNIKRYLGWIRQDVEPFNISLSSFTKQLISQRKKKILDDIGIVNALGIPIKRQDNIETYSVPIIHKKLRIEPPKVRGGLFKPEPALYEECYENILETIFNMILVMERNPKTFSKLKENEIRDHFLMILNANYKWDATGETFNCEGKTDILIRFEGKNVFIAECKFWEGENGLIGAINQLLKYTSWRDTKIAILIFNKNKNLSSVLSKINPVVKSHTCYKREHNLKSKKLENETIFSFVFHQPNDKNRELILTIMVFDVPE